METTERIVEAYVRYVKGWATIPNIKCAGQKEIDLFAIDPVTNVRHHIETTVSISQVYSELTDKPFSPGDHKIRGKAAGARRTLGFFLQEKFETPAVLNALARYGPPQDVRRVIVAWKWKPEVALAAAGHRIELWDFRELMQEIARLGRNEHTYFGDDTLRTLTLFEKALASKSREP